MDFLPFACDTARAAGELLREGFGQAKQITHKGLVDLVTEYDHRAEALILNRIRAAYPSHAIWAEESGRTAEAEYEWLVDPLDGTVNFAHGFPAFAVSLALTRARQVLVGVVYDPLRNELFAAAAGQAATLNGLPIHVSTETNLERSLLATGFPYDVRTSTRNNFAEFQRFYLHAQAVRRAGSAALDCVWVAAGRLEGYWEFWINPWDIAAGALIAHQAGGRVTTAQGDADFLGQKSILVSNGHVHDSMLTLLNETG